ncbi:MAG: type I secretion C-terminal target domain-containing protein [Alphaproteobacteria bacterium]|nr:type I secretion C-terminal target domain-containing protein [Alphaproteobacteria bacterium]
MEYSLDTANTDTDNINLGSGDDILNATVDFELYNNSIIQLGSGNDNINALNIGLNDNAVLNTGSGNDTFNVTGIWIYGNSNVDTGSGNDIINGYIDIWDDASLSMGSGNDTIFGNLWVGSATNVYMGDGDDLIRITGTTETFGLYNGSNIYFGDGNDTLDSGNSVPYLQGDIFFGSGDDVFLGNYLYFSPAYSVYMGDGDDIVNTGTQGAYNFDNADFFLGSGNDTFYIRGTGEIEQVWGEADADTYIFSFVGGTTTINDFSMADGDVIDISQILTGYDPMSDLISDFVRFVDVGADAYLQVDSNGGADGFTTLVTLIGGAGLDASTLEISGNLDTVV